MDPAHQRCEKDADCMLTMTKCSCHCGVPIHKKHWNHYLALQEKMCRDYKGKKCKMRCDQKLACVSGKCRIVSP